MRYLLLFFLHLAVAFIYVSSSVMHGQNGYAIKNHWLKISEQSFGKQSNLDTISKAQGKHQLKARPYLVNNDTLRINKNFPVLPLEVGVSDTLANAVKIRP